MADWSSIWAGFGILWGGLALYTAYVVVKMRHLQSNRVDSTPKKPGQA